MITDRTSELDAIVQRHDLNQHPFYQEWVAGTLPMAKLQSYAAEYGHFIGTIAEGWETMGEFNLAEEEREHEVLWQTFRDAIGAGTAMVLPETGELVATARHEFARPAACVGALYAFEAQQPHTSASKLAGLNAHYSMSEAGKEYFKVHADDIREVEILSAAVEKLSEAEFAAAVSACEKVCKGMWLALDGVYGDGPILNS